MINIRINNHIIGEIQLVIFDKDGTIMDLYHYWSQIIYLRAKFICQKLEQSQEHQNNLLYEMGVDVKKGRLRPEGPVGLKKKRVCFAGSCRLFDFYRISRYI